MKRRALQHNFQARRFCLFMQLLTENSFFQIIQNNGPLVLTINTSDPIGQMWGKGEMSFGPGAEVIEQGIS